MTKKMKMMGLVGLIGMLVTTGYIGYVIGDNYGLDIELFLQILMVYVPPIIGSIFATMFIIGCKKDNVVDEVKEA